MSKSNLCATRRTTRETGGEHERRDEGEGLPLFETEEEGRYAYRVAYKVFAFTISVGILLIWIYRVKNFPGAGEERGWRWCWTGMLMAEVVFGVYWVITQSVRWHVTHHRTFKERLLCRHGDKLPGVDVFVCTADPTAEPPVLVMNTILSVMSYNYPTEKLSIYLSDDAASEITFYAFLQASQFSKSWIPFCKRFNVKPRSPEFYFSQHSRPQDIDYAPEWLRIKKLYEEMRARIESICEKGRVPQEIRKQHKGFSEWNSNVSKQDHQPIVQIIINGRDTYAEDSDGNRLPTLVYIAREKRPQFPHNFKAGSMNATIRLSSKISNGPIILNLDCDMYANDPDAILEALCFFMDEEKGHNICYVQHPQTYNNISKNDIYANSSAVAHKLELAGIGSCGSALYCGTGCFHRRDSLSGMKCFEEYSRGEWLYKADTRIEGTIKELEESAKILATSDYEKDAQWGKEMGLIYGCPVEDIITGLTIQCRGWKSMYYNPEQAAFMGVAPITLDQALVQYKRWSEGLFQIFFSKYCPFIYGHNKIKLGAQMGYCVYLLWAPLSLPTLCYVIVPSLCLLHGIPLFPEVSNLWFIPFAYVFLAKNIYGMVEAMHCGTTLKMWWNWNRMWVIRRTTSYFFAFFDTIMRQLGFSQTAFAITAKVVTNDVAMRYDKEIMEFGSLSISFAIVATLALLNLFCLVGGTRAAILNFKGLVSQFVICWLLVMVNFPVYQALFFRSDKGRLPFSIVLISVVIASLACLVPI